MVSWLESTLGPYPFDRIGAVVVPSDSAMETQTLLTMGSRAYRRIDFSEVILHELAHQWYGDAVTPDNWKDLWLNESFAMYIQVRWEVHHGGSPWKFWIDYWKANDQRWRNQDGPPGAYDKGEFGDICVYYCGALMLRELRGKVGPARFDAALRAWVQQHHNATADRATYIRWLNSVTGRHLGPWIKHWLTARTSPVGQ
jgi:aminopeptidase N